LRSRWFVASLITAAIAISYFDRQTLPVAIQAIGHDIPISDVAFSKLQAAFLLSYAIFYAVSGALIDKLGVRAGFILTMGFWSVACAAHGFATGFSFLLVARFLLGAGEGGGFPAATRAIAEWFADDERSSAMGMVNAGTAVGSVIAPPLIALILLHANWRWMFVLSGVAGVAWCLFWTATYRKPAKRDEPLSFDLDKDCPAWSGLLRLKQVWGLMIAKFLSDAAWYFYLFWLPKYLYDSRGFDIQHIGSLGWIPYAASGVGSLTGGWLSSWLVRRNNSVNLARKVTLLMSALLMPFILS
jgi:MFS transporter, ACS family, hexuronate transporter